MSVALFKRAYRCTVDTVQISELDCSFKVVRDLKAKSPNTAEIEIRNLSEAHRRQMEQNKTVRVHLEAGYQKPDGAAPAEFSTMSLIYAGDLRQVGTTWEGPTSITKISTGDGEAKHRKARVKRSYGPGTSIKKVIQDLAAALGVGAGNLSKLGAAEFAKVGAVFSGGTVTSGSAADELDRLLTSAGYEYSIQDGNLQILPRGQALAGKAVVLSAASGLIGSPHITSDGVLHGKCLMVPDVFPGRLIEMRSKGVVGFFRLSRCEYTGDMDGTEWGIEFEGKESVGTRERVAA